MTEPETIGDVPNAELDRIKSNQVESMRLWNAQLQDMFACSAEQRLKKWGNNILSNDLIHERQQTRVWLRNNDPMFLESE